MRSPNRQGDDLDRDQLNIVAMARRMLRDGTGRQLRRSAGLSLADVAAAVKVDQAALAKWETGQRVPRVAAALRYAEVMADLVPIVTFGNAEVPV